MHEIHLHLNVHRGHACACALLVVPDDRPIDLQTRLAALHARREGVHRFVLLVQNFAYHRTAGHDLPGAPGLDVDSVERQARELFVTLGVDGDAIPAVRSVQGDLAADMRALLAALDDLPPFLAPDPLRHTPPSLTREAALLDTIHPLLTAANRLEQTDTTLTRTAALRQGGGGSHLFGVPYLDRDDPWPDCRRCDRALACILQIDARDVPDDLELRGLWVVFGCERCDLRVIHHHADPSPQRRRPDPDIPDLLLQVHQDERTVLTPTLLGPHRRVWQLPQADVFAEHHPYLAARLRTLARGETDLLDLARTLGLDPSPGAHIGGHPGASDHPVPPTPRHCAVCHAVLARVVEVAPFGRPHTLWACREHPAAAAFVAHPLPPVDPDLDDPSI